MLCSWLAMLALREHPSTTSKLKKTRKTITTTATTMPTTHAPLTQGGSRRAPVRAVLVKGE